MASRYDFLTDTYETEILKTLSVWSMCGDGDLDVRPRAGDRRGRTLREHMVHQCASENLWFQNMLGITVTAQPLPGKETRVGFQKAYAEAARARLQALRDADDTWWEEEVAFFEVKRPRTWVMVRRIAHTAHHRGQQTALLRMLGRDLHSTYGPTADTGGLMKDQAPVIYPYPDLDTLLSEEQTARHKAPLPAPPGHPVTERP